MNEDLNLVEILKNCPSGTKLYSPIYGDVELVKVIQVEDDFLSSIEDDIYPIKIKLNDNSLDNFTKDGRMFEEFGDECMLFPSKDQRDWSKFKPNKPKFDPKTLQPFDKVLVRDSNVEYWRATLYSHKTRDIEVIYSYATSDSAYIYCIPYNDDTKHLIGTNEEAPEYYRYWEE